MSHSGTDSRDHLRQSGSVYQIRLLGRLDQSWTAWFDGLTISYVESEGANETILTGPFVDQAALRGTLAKLWDLRLTLISVMKVEDDLDPGNSVELEKQRLDRR